MIIPSIDIMGGQAVQLVGGDENRRQVEAGDPRPLAEKFFLGGDTAVIDLDAAMGKGSNAELIRGLLKRGPTRVGGGIRDLDTARDWLDAGAKKIIVGTAATPEFLRELPKERVMVALDTREGFIHTHGWKTNTGVRIQERLGELRELVSGFLITFIENEGRMGGTQLDKVKDLVAGAGDARVTIAGGVTTVEELRALDQLGADAQVGMALYTGKLDFAEAWLAPMKSDRSDGLWPTVVTDEHGIALGLVYSDEESVKAAIDRRCGIYHSRSRGLWVKGETSGDTQELLALAMDCDRDALRFTVRQKGAGFCHLATRSCWGEVGGLGELARTLGQRAASAPPGSYTKRLLEDRELLAAKLREEVEELIAADSKDEVRWEAADVVYFTLVRMVADGVSLKDLELELDGRALKVRRRPGNAKDRD